MSSADLYPPPKRRSQGPRASQTYEYNPMSYASINSQASTDFLGVTRPYDDGSTANLNAALSDAGTTLYGDSSPVQNFKEFESSASYGQTYVPESAGPPEAMLRNHQPRGKRGLFDGRRKWYWAIAAILLLIAIIAGVVGGVLASHKSRSSGGDSNGIGSNSATNNGYNAPVSNAATLFGNGTKVTMDNGESFTYINNFGGYFSTMPYDDSARAQSWVPPLNRSWNYQNNRIFGVNLGGWLIVEPFITPALFEPYANDDVPAIDEYTLMGKLGSNAVSVMTKHYETFITEHDIAQMAAAGLNWIRLPIGYWAIETLDGEPFIQGLSWKYALRAIEWCRKYGIRVLLDLHAMPGSQNGQNHSGKIGQINWMNGTSALTNAQRGLNYVRTFAEFISQPQYTNVVPMLELVNEPMEGAVGMVPLQQWYNEAYKIVRGITGIGKGPWILFHDGFADFPAWAGFLAGGDRIALDQHNYMAFSEQLANPISYNVPLPCSYWQQRYVTSLQQFGMSLMGEWALDLNDCGEYLNGVNVGSRYEGTYIAPDATTPEYNRTGSCAPWNDYQSWNQTFKTNLMNFAYAHMDAAQNWFFWTWKIGNSTKTGAPVNPLWSMQLGLQQGYFPSDPRKGNGSCPVLQAGQGFATLPATSSFTSFPSAWMTGGAGAGTITADTKAYATFPPTSMPRIGRSATNLPVYTATGTPITLSPAYTPTAYPSGATKTVQPGSGWVNPSDTAGYYTAINGCDYVDAYSGVFEQIPAARCTGS